MCVVVLIRKEGSGAPLIGRSLRRLELGPVRLKHVQHMQPENPSRPVVGTAFGQYSLPAIFSALSRSKISVLKSSSMKSIFNPAGIPWMSYRLVQLSQLSNLEQPLKQ